MRLKKPAERGFRARIGENNRKSRLYVAILVRFQNQWYSQNSEVIFYGMTNFYWYLLKIKKKRKKRGSILDVADRYSDFFISQEISIKISHPIKIGLRNL